MSKIAILVPTYSMIEMAKEIAGNSSDITDIRVVKTTECVEVAKDCIEKGARIIIARGVQAQYIINHTNIPVAEMVLTGQELGLLISKAKKIVSKKNPKIAIIGLANMFSDMTHYNEIYEIDLRTYLVDNSDKLSDCVDDAINEKCDIIIGGELVCEIADKNNVKSIFLESTDDSIKFAIDTAKKMSYTAEVVSSYITEFETVLDTSVQGIIKMDSQKKITVINKTAKEILKKQVSKIIGKEIVEVIKTLNGNHIDELFEGQRDIYSTSITINDNPVMVTIIPLYNNDEIFGAIATCYRLSVTNKDSVKDKTVQSKLNSKKMNFFQMENQSKEMNDCIELAKMYALSKNPILIYGETGTEKEELARCIHNSSAFKNGPFISVNCSSISEEKQIEMLFGSNENSEIGIKGALEIGEGGTIFITEIESLSQVCQYRLYRSLMYEVLMQNDLENNKILNIRVIVSTKNRLENLVKDGLFREDLYFLLNGLVLTITSMRNRQTDIRIFVNKKLDEFSKISSKHLSISEKAYEVIENYEWVGNKIQLTAFLERLFITTPKKLITEEIVHFVLDELYPEIMQNNEHTKLIVYKHPEAKKIQELLTKHNGSRKKVANEMNISLATLWRHMKKYGIVN